MTVTGILAVQARIGEIQARFGGAPSGATTFADDLQIASNQLASTSGPAWSAGTAGSAGSAGAAGAAGSTPASVVPAPRGTTGSDVVAIARDYLGVPYVWGGNDPKTGLDCSGLTELVYRRLGIDIPPVSWQQAKAGRPVASMADARPGDLLAFNSPVSHIGIYIGDGKMIHAPRPGKQVEVSPVYDQPTAIRRILPDQASAPTRPAPALASGASLAAGTPYAAEFRAAEARTGVPARVLAAVAKAESGFRADAVSPAGAQGLMQLMPATARELGADPANPASAIDGAARLLKRHLGEFGSLELALAAYNAGEGTVRRYGGIPPYPETRNYVAKVLATVRGSAS